MNSESPADILKWVGILQPGYLPWLGYFDQWDRVDEFIILDHVQFTRRDWRSRNRILTATGPIWLTVPVKGTVDGHTVSRVPIHTVPIDYEQDWVRKHLAAIQHNYSKAPFFEAYFPALKRVYEQKFPLLADFDLAVAKLIGDCLGIRVPVCRSSTMPVQHTKGDLILELCQMAAATDYYSGAAAMDYLQGKREEFAAAGIRVFFQNYQPVPYPQQYGSGFTSHLCILDLLFNVGSQAIDVIRAGRGPEQPLA